MGKPYHDKELMTRLYLDKGMSMPEIAEELDCVVSTVYTWLHKHGIPTRKSPSQKPPHYRTNQAGYEKIQTQIGDEWHTVRVHRLVAVAEHGFDAVAGKDIHHSNGIPWDNRPANLELLTRSEHTKLHESG